jgi:hypothetical protein
MFGQGIAKKGVPPISVVDNSLCPLEVLKWDEFESQAA